MAHDSFFRKRNLIFWLIFNMISFVNTNSPLVDTFFGFPLATKRPLLLKICHTYPTMMKVGTFIPYLNKIQKNIDHVTNPWVLLKSAAFPQKSTNFAISRNIDIDCLLIICSSYSFLIALRVSMDCFNKHGYNFDDVSKSCIKKYYILK